MSIQTQTISWIPENDESNFSIYRLCRDKATVQKFNKIDKKYKFPKSFNITGPDYFQFLRKILKECTHDYALVVHDDVLLPIEIRERIKDCISKCNLEFGAENWGIIGNAGIEFLSKKAIRFIRDPHSNIISSNSKRPYIATFLDGNTLLLNVKNLREKGVTIPKNLKGFHLYDFVAVIESYKKGLICGIDSTLYNYHKSGGDQEGFDKAKKDNQFISYWKRHFINHMLYTLNGVIEIKNTLEYLKKESKDQRVDYYQLVFNVLKKIYYAKDKKTINIIWRLHNRRFRLFKRLLDSILVLHATHKDILNFKVIISVNVLQESEFEKELKNLIHEYTELDISYTFAQEPYDHYARVEGISNALKIIKEEKESYVWMIDYDDYVLPVSAEYFPILLHENNLIVGDSLVFREKWSETGDNTIPISAKHIRTEESKNWIMTFSGENFIPLCSVIYPTKVLKKIFEKFALKGDYYEDYAIFLLALKEVSSVRDYPISLTSIGFHGQNVVLEKDRTHWDYSYTTFLSEIVNKGDIIPQPLHTFFDVNIGNLPKEFIEFRGFTQGKMWKTLLKYRKIKSRIIRFISKCKSLL